MYTYRLNLGLSATPESLHLYYKIFHTHIHHTLQSFVTPLDEFTNIFFESILSIFTIQIFTKNKHNICVYIYINIFFFLQKRLISKKIAPHVCHPFSNVVFISLYVWYILFNRVLQETFRHQYPICCQAWMVNSQCAKFT